MLEVRFHFSEHFNMGFIALSAYQKAFSYNKIGFWRGPDALYGLGVAYFHFRAYNP